MVSPIERTDTTLDLSLRQRELEGKEDDLGEGGRYLYGIVRRRMLVPVCKMKKGGLRRVIFGLDARRSNVCVKPQAPISCGAGLLEIVKIKLESLV